MGFDLIAYGFMMAGLGVAAARFAPSLATWAFITGLCACGGGLLWGVPALFRRQYRKAAVLTLAIVSGLALWLHVGAWRLPEQEGTRDKLPIAVTGLMLFLSIGQTVLVARGDDKGEK